MCYDDYECVEDRVQSGHDLDISKQKDEEHCAARCCNVAGCIAYDYKAETKDCWLSATPREQVALTISKGTKACRKNPGKHLTVKTTYAMMSD